MASVHTTYIRYIFHVKTQLFVTAKSDQDPDLHDSALVDSLASDPYRHWCKKLDPEPDTNSHWNNADPQHSFRRKLCRNITLSLLLYKHAKQVKNSIRTYLSDLTGSGQGVSSGRNCVATSLSSSYSSSVLIKTCSASILSEKNKAIFPSMVFLYLDKNDITVIHGYTPGNLTNATGRLLTNMIPYRHGHSINRLLFCISAVQYPYCLCLHSDWLGEQYCTLKTSVQCTDCLTSVNFQMFL